MTRYYERRLLDVILEELLENDATPPMIFEGSQLPHILVVKHKWNKEEKYWTQFEINIPSNHFDEIINLDFEILKDKYYREINFSINDKKPETTLTTPEGPAKKFCDSCGMSLPIDERFCPSCGNILEMI